MTDAKLVIVEDAGHLITLETPERVNQEITRFLA
jgi:pimeloyl-ACP methyl ester carboxylesterase